MVPKGVPSEMELAVPVPTSLEIRDQVTLLPLHYEAWQGTAFDLILSWSISRFLTCINL